MVRGIFDLLSCRNVYVVERYTIQSRQLAYKYARYLSQYVLELTTLYILYIVDIHIHTLSKRTDTWFHIQIGIFSPQCFHMLITSKYTFRKNLNWKKIIFLIATHLFLWFSIEISVHMNFYEWLKYSKREFDHQS